MQTTGIRHDDILALDVRGQTFHALVAEPPHIDKVLKRRVVKLKPLTPGGNLPAYTVTAQQITDHWRKKRRRKGTNPE